MTCYACREAETNPDGGGYFTGCSGCDIRFLSRAPKFIREERYAKATEAERERLIAEVNQEFTRRQALRRAKGVG
jgi:hypothetical protein